MLWTTEGHFVAQVSDLYVIAQYAQALAEGTRSTTTRARRRPPAPRACSTPACWRSPTRPGRAARGSSPSPSCWARRSTSPRSRSPRGSPRGSRGRARACSRRRSSRSRGPWSGATSTAPTSRSSCSSPCCCSIAGSRSGAAAPRGARGRRARSWRSPGPRASRSRLVIAVAGRWRTPASRVERLWLLAAGRGRARRARAAARGHGLVAFDSVAEKSLWPNYGPVETLAVASKYGVDVLRGLLLGLYPPESAIGFARGEASFFFPPLALAARPAGRGPAGRPARGPRAAVARARGARVRAHGAERLHGRPLQSLPDVGLPRAAGPRRGGPRRR